MNRTIGRIVRLASCSPSSPSIRQGTSPLPNLSVPLNLLSSSRCSTPSTSLRAKGGDKEDDDKPAFNPNLDFEQLKNSKFLGSEVVQREVEELMKQFAQVSSLFPKFFDWDVAGQRYYIGEMEKLLDRIQTFLFRAKMTDDPAAKQIINTITVQMMNAGMSFESMNQAMGVQVKQMTQLVDELERLELSGDFARLKKTKEDLKAYMQSTNPAARMDYSKVVQDPAFEEALRDPDVMRAYAEVAENPAAFAKYRGTKLEAFLRKVGLVPPGM